MTINSNQFSFSHLSDEELDKARASVGRRINNLHSRFGGFISTDEKDHSVDMSQWVPKKRKLVAEQEAIRQEYQSR
jgi:hypothetical protein